MDDANQMHETLSKLIEWINFPIFHVGQTPVTFGGIGSAFFIVIMSFFISAVLQRVLVQRLSIKFHLASGLSYAFSRILHYSIVLLGIVIATQCIGLNLGALAVVFGFLSVGIGFGLQNITSNFIAGLILLFERPIAVGDFVKVENYVGSVMAIHMRATVIETLDRVSIIVPNSKFIEEPVINWSHGDPRVRLHCPVGVAYGSDIPKVKEALWRVAEEHEDVLKHPEPDVRFLQFGNSSLDFELLVWLQVPGKQEIVRSQINYAIDEAFRREEIRIPFPQRDLHLQMTPAVEKLSP